LKKQLKGKKRKIGHNKWEFVVNMGLNPETGIYERKYLTFYGNDRESDAALRAFIYELENPELVAAQTTLNEYLAEWYQNYYIPNHEQTSNTRAERIIRNNINPYIGHIPIGELSTDHVQTMYNILLKEGKIKRIKIKEGEQKGEIQTIKSPLSPRTVKYVHVILNQSLNHAVGLGKIPHNPCAKAIPPKDKEEAPEKWVVLSAQELKAFLNDERCKNHRDYALIHTAAYSGARQSELLGLTKDRILRDKSAIRIDQSLHKDEDSENGFEHKQRTKNKRSTRTIKLSAKAMAVLTEHIKRQEEAGIESTLVFTEPDGEPIGRNNLGSRFAVLAEKLGYPGMTFHHLRHTHATILLSAGWYINDVSKRLGHAKPSITLNVYGHCLQDSEDSLVAFWDSLME
jgi:integrase